MSSGLKLGNTLIRADLNVPIHEKVVKDNFRIIKAIEYLVDLRKISKSVTFLSHLGRPEGINLNYSLKPVAEEMSLLLDVEVVFISSLHG